MLVPGLVFVSSQYRRPAWYCSGNRQRLFGKIKRDSTLYLPYEAISYCALIKYKVINGY